MQIPDQSASGARRAGGAYEASDGPGCRANLSTRQPAGAEWLRRAARVTGVTR